MDKKQMLIKEKFNSKLEIKKRKEDFYLKFNEIRQAQNDVVNKNNEIREIIKQEKLNESKYLKKLRINQKRDLETKKKQIANQKHAIRNDEQKFKESIKLEIAKTKQNILNQKMKSNRELLKAKTERKQKIFENKKLIQKIKQKDQNERIKQKNNKEKKKVEISRMQVQHLEQLGKQKKELEDIKKQYMLAKLNSSQKMEKIKNERMQIQKNRREDLETQIRNEKQNLELDIVKMKNENISYKNLLKLKNVEAKISAEKLKLETAKIKQENIVLENNFEDESVQTFTNENISDYNEIKSNKFFVEKTNSETSLFDKKAIPPKIDLTSKTIKGIIINEAGRRALRIFNKVNKLSSKPFHKLKISKQEKDLIEKVRKLKAENSLTPISDYVEMAAFSEGKEFNKNKVQAIIISIIYNLLKGKTLSFLGGYFSVIKVKGCRKIVYSKDIGVASKLSIINLPDSNTTQRFEKILAEKLEYSPFIKISENIVLSYINNEIRLISDVAFMR